MGLGTDHRHAAPAPARTPREQHPLWLSIALHLFPGAALVAFVLLLTPVPGGGALVAFLLGIVALLAPLELGYLAVPAKRTHGTWSPLAAVGYRTSVPARRLVLLTVGTAAARPMRLAAYLGSA